MSSGLSARFVFALLLVLRLSPATAVAETCNPPSSTPGVDAFCGATAPEDLVRLGDDYLIASSMTLADQLYLFDIRRAALLPMVTRIDAVAGEPRWGDPECAPPSALVTHGLDLRRRADGAWQLLAVNHAEPESVEFFAVVPGPSGQPELHWRGCVEAPPEAEFNDVAGLPDGGFLATDPLTASWHTPRMLLGMLGINTGSVYRWRPAQGFEKVPHTAGAYPNGVLLAADGESFYVNLYLDGEVREHALDSGEILNRVAVPKPDNSSLDEAGNLLVASHRDSIFALVSAVSSPPEQRNSIPFDIVQIDPRSFESSVLYTGSGQEIGAGTVAVQVGQDLFIGAFRGDRMIRVRGAFTE
jgi:hypothetical protein